MPTITSLKLSPAAHPIIGIIIWKLPNNEGALFFLWKNKLEKQRLFLRLSFLSIPLAYVASHRITSYNVCYTKLLRAFKDGSERRCNFTYPYRTNQYNVVVFTDKKIKILYLRSAVKQDIKNDGSDIAFFYLPDGEKIGFQLIGNAFCQFCIISCVWIR